MVDMNPNNAQSAEDDIWGFIQGERVKTLTFTQTDQWGNKSPMQPGSFYEGDLKELPTRRQQTDPETGDLKSYQDGNPMWNIVLTLSTAYRDPADPDDDGTRRIYLNRFGQQGLQQEMARLGIKKFGPGTHVKWILTGFKPNGGTYQPSKLQAIELTNVQEALTPAQAGAQQMMAQGARVQAGPDGQPVQTFAAPPQQVQQQPVQQPQGAMPPQAAQYQPQGQPVQAVAQPAVQQVPAQQPVQQPVQQQPVAQPVQQQAPAAPPAAPAQSGELDAATAARIADGAQKLLGVGFAREQVVQALAAMPENAGLTPTQIDDAIPV